MTKLVDGVATFAWNPPRFKRLTIGSREWGPRMNNFGDLLGPEIVEAQVRSTFGDVELTAVQGGRSLFSVGSVLHFAAEGDVVWGTGINRKVVRKPYEFEHLDVRAVRGPLTREWLWKTKTIESPEIYGDPALLLMEDLRHLRSLPPVRRLSVIPNLNDAKKLKTHRGYFSPRHSMKEVARRIAGSEQLVTSSLHALIFAEMLGVPAVLFVSESEPFFKYEDYFRGSGRSEWLVADDVTVAERLVASLDRSTFDPLAAWDNRPLTAAFPHDLWKLK